MKPEPETQKEETPQPAGLAAVATVRQPLPPVALECQRLRAELAVAARRVEDLTRENARQATEIEATCWQSSPGMAQAKMNQLNAEVERLRAALEEIKHAGSAEWARKRAERALETTL